VIYLESLEAILPRWEGEGKDGWAGKCEICYSNFLKGIQHPNSLHCHKLGIPYSAIKDLTKALEILKKILDEIPNTTYKYMTFQGVIKPFTNGVIILYFESEKDMLTFISKFKELGKEVLKDPNNIESIFYRFIVNTDRIDTAFYYRRGCPEYDLKFGSWRKWPKL